VGGGLQEVGMMRVCTQFGAGLLFRCALRWIEYVQDGFSRPTNLSVIAASGQKNQRDNVLLLERKHASYVACIPAIYRADMFVFTSKEGLFAVTS
jgi:hypothetical protein